MIESCSIDGIAWDEGGMGSHMCGTMHTVAESATGVWCSLLCIMTVDKT